MVNAKEQGADPCHNASTAMVIKGVSRLFPIDHFIARGPV